MIPTRESDCIHGVSGAFAGSTSCWASIPTQLRCVIWGFVDFILYTVLCTDCICISKNKECQNEYFGDSMPSKNTNSNSHPKVTPGSHEYDVIAERNALDMVLYKYIQFLYSEQRSMIDSYAA